MMDSEAVEAWIDYLDDTKPGDWCEKGLIEGAPPEAVEAYERYKQYMIIMKAEGIVV